MSLRRCSSWIGIQPTSSFDVAADGRFVMIRDETAPATSIEVVLNWTEQLER